MLGFRTRGNGRPRSDGLGAPRRGDLHCCPPDSREGQARRGQRRKFPVLLGSSPKPELAERGAGSRITED